MNLRRVSFESPLARGFSSLVIEEMLTASSSECEESRSENYRILEFSTTMERRYFTKFDVLLLIIA